LTPILQFISIILDKEWGIYGSPWPGLLRTDQIESANFTFLASCIFYALYTKSHFHPFEAQAERVLRNAVVVGLARGQTLDVDDRVEVNGEQLNRAAALTYHEEPEGDPGNHIAQSTSESHLKELSHLLLLGVTAPRHGYKPPLLTRALDIVATLTSEPDTSDLMVILLARAFPANRDFLDPNRHRCTPSPGIPKSRALRSSTAQGSSRQTDRTRTFFLVLEHGEHVLPRLIEKKVTLDFTGKFAPTPSLEAAKANDDGFVTLFVFRSTIATKANV